MPERSKKLLRNTFIYAVGNFGSKVLSFALVPLYSFYLSKEDFGYFDLVITTISLLVPIVTLQLTDSIFRWLITSENDENIIKDTITNGYFVIMLNILVVVLLSTLSYLIYPLKNQILITLMLISATIYPFFQQTIRGLMKNKLYALNGILYAAIYLASNVILLIGFSFKIEALFISAIIANISCSIFILYKINIFKYFYFERVSKNKIREFLKYSGPLIPNSISWWLISSANNYIILIFLGVSANGIYGMANRFPALLLVINQIFILAWQESAIVNFNNQDREVFYAKILNKLIKIQLSVALILILMSQFLATNILGSEYYESWKYMPILYLGVALSTFSGFYGTIYLSTKKTSGAFYTTLIGGMVNLMFALMLVRNYGLMGVAFSTFLGYLVLFIVRIITTRKIIKLELPYKSMFTYSMLCVIALFVTYIGNITYSLLLALVYSIIFIGINFTFLKKTTNLIFIKLNILK